MPERTLILLGAGGHAAVVAESAVAGGWRILGYCAEEQSREGGCTALMVPWIGPSERLSAEGERILENSLKHGARLHTAVGDARQRERWCSRFGQERLATIVHPGAWISPSANVAPGVYVGAFAAVNATASIGLATIVNTSAVVEHGVRIGACAHIAPGAVIAGMVEIGERTLIGAGAVVLPFVKIGADVIVGAGAVVHRDVEAHATVAGNPARPLPAEVRSMKYEV